VVTISKLLGYSSIAVTSRYLDHLTTTSVASLARYARPSAKALARWQERNDPATRR
jgi:hypothetical protein